MNSAFFTRIAKKKPYSSMASISETKSSITIPPVDVSLHDTHHRYMLLILLLFVFHFSKIVAGCY